MATDNVQTLRDAADRFDADSQAPVGKAPTDDAPKPGDDDIPY